MRAIRLSVLLLLTALCAGCRHGQQPAAAGSTTDSTVVTDILAYRQKTFAAENAVLAFIKADNRSWVQHEFGWWYYYTHKGPTHSEDATMPSAMDSCCIIHETVYLLDSSLIGSPDNSLNGTMLQDAVREYVYRDDAGEGADSEPFTYTIMLSELVPQDTILLIIPWYLAYGEKGTDNIPPCTNICVRLTLHNLPYQDVEEVENANEHTTQK